MTAARGLRRRRRAKGVEEIPADLARWFAGEPPANGGKTVPWSALIYPDFAVLHDRWLVWKAEHPDARPPAGYESIEHPPTGHAAQLVAPARALIEKRGR